MILVFMGKLSNTNISIGCVFATRFVYHSMSSSLIAKKYFSTQLNKGTYLVLIYMLTSKVGMDTYLTISKI